MLVWLQKNTSLLFWLQFTRGHPLLHLFNRRLSSNFHSLTHCTPWTPDKGETRRGTRELPVHCVPRPVRLSDGGPTHVGRTSPALSAGEPTAAAPSWESWEARDLSHPGCLPSSQSMPPESMETEFTAPFSLCKAAARSTHLGNYSPLFPNFTFYCQTSPCFPPPPLWTNTSQLPLIFFTLRFSKSDCWCVFCEIVLVQDWRKQEDRQQDISLSTLWMVWSEIKCCVVCSVKACVHVHMSSARSVWQAWKTCLALLGHKWMFDG